MKNYTRYFAFKVTNTWDINNKIILYLNSYDFQLLEQNSGQMVFAKKWSLREGWRFNPLNWESKLKIKRSSDGQVEIAYSVMNNGMLSPLLFASLYSHFIANLGKFLNNDIDFKKFNRTVIKIATSKAIGITAFFVFLIMVGFLVGIAFEEMVGIKYISVTGVLLGSILCHFTLKKYLVKKVPLHH